MCIHSTIYWICICICFMYLFYNVLTSDYFFSYCYLGPIVPDKYQWIDAMWICYGQKETNENPYMGYYLYYLYTVNSSDCIGNTSQISDFKTYTPWYFVRQFILNWEYLIRKCHSQMQWTQGTIIIPLFKREKYNSYCSTLPKTGKMLCIFAVIGNKEYFCVM